MLNKLDIAKDWLPRYTGMPLDKFGENILLELVVVVFWTHYADTEILISSPEL